MQLLSSPARDARVAFTLTEIMVAVGVIGILFVSLYTAFSAGFSMIRATRENLGATEVLVQRMESLRLYSWSQLTVDPTFFPTNFTSDSNTLATLGTIYYGTIERVAPNFLENPNYKNDMRIITVSVRWTNSFGKPMPHYRAMQTLVAKNGMIN